MKDIRDTAGPNIRFTTEHVMALRDLIGIGDRVRAEVYKNAYTGETVLYPTEVLYVTIIEKYPHVALTDRGTVSLVNILLNNTELLRRLK